MLNAHEQRLAIRRLGHAVDVCARGGGQKALDEPGRVGFYVVMKVSQNRRHSVILRRYSERRYF